jgi:hypothetical protein
VPQVTTRPDDAFGKCGTEEIVMTRLRPTRLVTRRHVDLLRTSSATCRR